MKMLLAFALGFVLAVWGARISQADLRRSMADHLKNDAELRNASAQMRASCQSYPRVRREPYRISL